MATETVDLRPLKRFLQKGEIAALCSEVGVTPNTGTNIIAGKTSNWQFVQKFLERVDRNKRLKERVNALILDK